MAKIIRNIPYPKLDDLYTSQQELKNCIKSIDQMFLDAGLQRSADSGQLDTNNIPDLDLQWFHAAGQNTGALYPLQNGTTNRTYIDYAPLVYMYTDTLHSTKPVYIKLLFRLCRCDAYHASKTKYLYTLIPNINIASSMNGSGNVQISMLNSDPNVYIQTLPVITYTSTATILLHKFLTTSNNSFVYYNESKGLFYCNILPNYKQTYIDTTTNITLAGAKFLNYNRYFPFINMYIIRNDVNCYVDILTAFNVSLSTSATNYDTSFSTISHFFYSDNTFYNDSVNNNYFESWKSFSLANTSSQNGMLTLSQLNILDYNKTPNVSPYMLISNVIGVPNAIGEVDVNIDATTTKKYVVRPSYEYNAVTSANVITGLYALPLTISSLIYVDD